MQIRATAPFELREVAVTTEANVASARVCVSRNGQTSEGRALLAATSTGRPDLVAKATLEAVKGAGFDPANGLEHASIVRLGDHQVASVVLVLIEPTGEEIVITGSWPVYGDSNDAVARATLDAVNRSRS